MTSAQLRDAGLLLLEKIPGGEGWLGAKKRWPAAMDQWPNARHGAGGNAVSRDLLVGPPRRVRWIAGGLAADRLYLAASDGDL